MIKTYSIDVRMDLSQFFNMCHLLLLEEFHLSPKTKHKANQDLKIKLATKLQWGSEIRTLKIR